MSNKILWALFLGLIGGFTFAAGDSLWMKTQSKIRFGAPTSSDSIGARSDT